MNFSVFSVGYLGKCLWSLMNCRKEKELECLNFGFFFSLFGQGEFVNLSTHMNLMQIVWVSGGEVLFLETKGIGIF